MPCRYFDESYLLQFNENVDVFYNKSAEYFTTVVFSFVNKNAVPGDRDQGR